MIDLTDREEIRKLDPKNVYDSTGMFSKQCEQIYKESKELIIPAEYKNILNIVLCGMGGSAYGGYVVNALLKDALSVPLYSNNDYTLPAFVNENTLVILSSYSGSTEEVLSCGEEAIKKGAKIVGITSGNPLRKFLTEHNFPALIFNPVNNPSGQPRLGMGYMVFGMLMLLNAIGIAQIEDMLAEDAITELNTNNSSVVNQAMTLSKELFGFFPVIFAAEFLLGNIHILRNQFNETAKSFSAFSPLPELNHHLMEGLKNPPDKRMKVLMIYSKLYSDVLKKRVLLTKDVVTKNNIPVLEYEPIGNSKLSQVLNTLSFGAYITLFLSLQYGQDPSLIPWVDYFKEQLVKNP